MKLWLGVGLAALLAGCNGGDGSQDVAPVAEVVPELLTPVTGEGVLIGTSSQAIEGGQVIRNVTGLMLEGGDYYVMYSSLSDPYTPAGIVMGKSRAQEGRFVSTEGKDINFEGKWVADVTMQAEYNPTNKIGLTADLRYVQAGTGISVSATYQSGFDKPADLATLAGAYRVRVGSSAGLQVGTLSVNAVGSISGGYAGCSMTGRVTPTAKAVMQLAMNLGAGCAITGTVAGVAHYDALKKMIMAAGPNQNRKDGFLIYGYRSGS